MRDGFAGHIEHFLNIKYTMNNYNMEMFRLVDNVNVFNMIGIIASNTNTLFS